MKIDVIFLDPGPAAETALLEAAAGLGRAAIAWREGATVTLTDSHRFVQAIQKHLATLNAYALGQAKAARWPTKSTDLSKE